MNLALLTMLTFPQRWLLQQEVPPVKRDRGRGSWEYLLHWLFLRAITPSPVYDKRTVHYGNKDTSPEKSTVRHVHEHPLGADIQKYLMQWNICCKPRQHWSRRYQLLDQQHPQRFASASSQWRVREISDQTYCLRNSMIEIILRGEEGGTRYSCTEERRLCISIECSTLWLKLDKEIQSQ